MAWLWTGSIVAWLVLVGWYVAAMRSHVGDSESMPGMDMGHGVRFADVYATSGVAWLGMWTLMVVAMMWPLAAASVARIAQATFHRWRASAVAAHMIAITAMWLAAGAIARTAYLAVGPRSPWWIWPVGWLTVACALSRSLWRTRLLTSCGRGVVIAPMGRRAVVSSASAARQGWVRCSALCGPVMMAMVGTHRLSLMAGGSAAVWWEQRHPRAFRDPVPVALLAATVVAMFVQSQ